MADMYERELGWNDSIEQDSTFVVLPEGEYDFEVVSFERARWPGSPKLPACPQAILSIDIMSPDGRRTSVKHNLFLHQKNEGILCSFFISIGQRRHGEKMQMNWGSVAGSRGRCKVVVDTWNHKTTGEKMEGNKIKKFLEPEAKGFKAGEF